VGGVKFSHDTSESRGVVTLFSKGLQYQIVDTLTNKDGRLVIVKIKVYEEEVFLTNLYAPNNNHHL
jgi:exonuclease III